MEISTARSERFAPIAPGGVLNGKPDHLARNGVDRGLARRNGKARLCHHADPLAGAENDPRAKRATANRCLNKRAMRDVRIVARILNDARRGAHAIGLADRHGEGRLPPPGSSISAVAGHSPVRSASQAARTAAAAQDPVVQPRRKGELGSSSESSRPLIAFPVILRIL